MVTLGTENPRPAATPEVKAITEEPCGHEFSATAISDINKTLDASLKAFAEPRLSEDFPYLIVDARYQRVRKAGGSSRSRAELDHAATIAIGQSDNNMDRWGGYCSPLTAQWLKVLALIGLDENTAGAIPELAWISRPP